MLETKDKAIELLYRALPYSDQIKNLDTSRYATSIGFHWRGSDYKLEMGTGSVYKIVGNLEETSDTCIVMRELFKKVHYAN